MTDDVTRIGRGVPGGTRPTPEAEPPKRRTTALLVSGGVVVGLGLAVLLVFGRSLFGVVQAGSPPQVPMPAVSSPSAKVLDEQATCVLLVPVATDAATVVSAVIANPNNADWAKVQKTYDDLKLISDMAAPELRDDIGQTTATLAQLLSLSRTGGKMTFDMTDFKAAGLRIGARCAKYAN